MPPKKNPEMDKSRSARIQLMRTILEKELHAVKFEKQILEHLMRRLEGTQGLIFDPIAVTGLNNIIALAFYDFMDFISDSRIDRAYAMKLFKAFAKRRNLAINNPTIKAWHRTIEGVEKDST